MLLSHYTLLMVNAEGQGWGRQETWVVPNQVLFPKCLGGFLGFGGFKTAV